MIAKIRHTKTGTIAETLRESILNREFPDGRLPSKKDLMSHFEVSQQTIDLVLKRLREEGLIRGVRGTGIFVNQQIPDVNNLTHRLVLLLMSRYTNYESEPYTALRTEALRRGLFPINLNMPDMKYKMSLQETASMTQLLRAPIHGVIYIGRSYWRHPFLDQWKNLRSVGLIHFDSDQTAPGSVIETDFTAAGYELGKHLFEQGAKKILLYFGVILPHVPKSSSYWDRHPSSLLLNGIGKVAIELGKEKPVLVFQQNPDLISAQDWQEELKRVIQGGVDGIVCASDDLAYKFISAAESLRIKVPEELMIAGCYDNVWGSSFKYQITSININAERMSKEAFDCIAAGGICELKVPPQIVYRQSTNRK